MKLKRMQIRELVKNSKYSENIRTILDIQGGKSSVINPKYVKITANCCGALAYNIGQVEKFKQYAEDLKIDEFLQLPFATDLHPGYIPPRAGLEFIRKDCYEVPLKEMQSGDIVLFMDRMFWCHAGVYLGNIEGNKIMFHKDGQESDFSFDNLETYEPLDHSTDKGFFRVRE